MAVEMQLWIWKWLLCASELWQWQTGSGGFWLRSSHYKSIAWWSQHWYFVMSVHNNWLPWALFRNKNGFISKLLMYFMIQNNNNSAKQSSSETVEQFQRVSVSEQFQKPKQWVFCPHRKHSGLPCLYLQSNFWTTHQAESYWLVKMFVLAMQDCFLCCSFVKH